MKRQTARSQIDDTLRGGDSRDLLTVAKRPGCADLCHHEAVRWFTGLGYVVEPGPGRDEVTSIDDKRPSSMAHIVVPADKLAAMASLNQTVTAQQFFRPRRLEIWHRPGREGTRR